MTRSQFAEIANGEMARSVQGGNNQRGWDGLMLPARAAQQEIGVTTFANLGWCG
jgi:hypothetical protein